jgi:uncharacterized protein
LHFSRAMPMRSISGRLFLRLGLIVVATAATALSVYAQQRASAAEPVKAAAPLITPATAPAAKVPSQPVPHIALLVPLASKTFGKAADALKQGFVAGAEADGKNASPYRVYATDDEGGSLAAQVRKAAAEGAVAIVGGVTRDGANMIARESRLLPTLALNAPLNTIDGELPDQFFYVSLNLDIEARLLARMVSGEGLRSVAIVVANNALAKRIQDSFENEWLRLGGEVAARISFGGDPNDATRVASAMEKIGAKASGVFLAADPAAARIVRPYLPTGMPVFATSHTVDPRAEAVVNLDLDNVRFLEMPWFTERDHPAVMAYAKPAQILPVELERLYALGIDAWRLGQLIAKSDPRKLPPLDGVTGRITLDGHQFTRALSSVEMRDGRSQLYRSPE